MGVRKQIRVQFVLCRRPMLGSRKGRNSEIVTSAKYGVFVLEIKFSFKNEVYMYFFLNMGAPTFFLCVREFNFANKKKRIFAKSSRYITTLLKSNWYNCFVPVQCNPPQTFPGLSYVTASIRQTYRKHYSSSTCQRTSQDMSQQVEQVTTSPSLSLWPQDFLLTFPFCHLT